MSKIKVCSKCKKRKELIEFNKHKGKPDGHQYHCKDCQAKATKKHYENNKESYLKRAKDNRTSVIEYIQKVKNASTCKCGEDNSATLVFHHKNKEDKLFEISAHRKLGRGLKKVKEEIRKCTIMCSNCHLKLHYEERHGSVV